MARAPGPITGIELGDCQGGCCHAAALAQEANQVFVAPIRVQPLCQMGEMSVCPPRRLHSTTGGWFAGHNYALPWGTRFVGGQRSGHHTARLLRHQGVLSCTRLSAAVAVARSPRRTGSKPRQSAGRCTGVVASVVGSPSQDAPAVRVLAVDDDVASLELIVAVLGSLAEVRIVQSGETALDELERGEFAVVLLDVGLPGIDGFETARLMKERPSTRHTPVIFLTGQIGDEQVRRGYELGAADYLLKPFDPEILRAKVKVFVDLARLRSEAETLSHRLLHD